MEVDSLEPFELSGVFGAFGPKTRGAAYGGGPSARIQVAYSHPLGTNLFQLKRVVLTTYYLVLMGQTDSPIPPFGCLDLNPTQLYQNHIYMILVKWKCRRYLKVFIVTHEVVAVRASTKPAITKAITTLGPLQRHNLGQKSLPKLKTFF